MTHDLEETIALLARMPAALDALLRGLPDIWTSRNEGENTWDARGIIGHLIHGERTDWMPRTRHVLEFGDTRPFDPFDRLGQQADSRSLDELLSDFARLRAANLHDLRALNLQPSDLERRALHPALGAVTLSHLLATWAAHDLSHLHQLSRVMAHQYREGVGAWGAYLGVMRCAGQRVGGQPRRKALMCRATPAGLVVGEARVGASVGRASAGKLRPLRIA